jgi:L-alanine-DL-glutamate epimerase-like enolase superfamily enzyme
VQSVTEIGVPHAAAPRDLVVTDLRIANLDGVPFRSTVLRLDTNHGISGYGEIRDQASTTYALMLKSRIVGENPCNFGKLLSRLRQFGHHGRQGGGVSGIEMALMDLAGKAYGVPVYALLGGRYRDEILCYADTPSVADPVQMGRRLLERRQRGFRFLKMDVGAGLLRGMPGALIAVPGAAESAGAADPPSRRVQVTAKGADYLAEYVRVVREIVGYDIPLAVDHLGHVDLGSCLRIGRALEPFALAWLEDLVPWQLTGEWRQLTEALATPTCTGEDIYLLAGFRPLIDAGAVRVVHPDPATAGGIMETKRIGDYAAERGISMALHLAGTPVATMAAVHAAAATENFVALEHHAADLSWWSDLVTGLPRPLISDGQITVPDTPGLGFGDIDPDAMRAHLDSADPVFFEVPTAGWDGERSHDQLWS